VQNKEQPCAFQDSTLEIFEEKRGIPEINANAK